MDRPEKLNPPSLGPQGLQLVATLFYSSVAAQEPRFHADKRPHSPGVPLPKASLRTLAHGAVPTETLGNYPLEPPTPGPDPLDNLYGAYISQSCVTDFYKTFESILPGFQEQTSTRRCLDSQSWPRVMEVAFSLPANSTITLHELRKNEAISRFERNWNIEAVFQASSVFRRHKRLAVFDMDSTLIQQEVIDEIARELGVEKEISAITAAAMNGEIDFEESLRKRCKLLRGVSSGVFETLKGRITLTPGAPELVRALRRLGYKTAVLSGGFTPLARWLAEKIGLDYFHANNLVVSEDGSVLTGELSGQIVHAERKRQLVMEIAARECVALEQVLVAGDGANDLPMMGIAGLGVAFNAKARVQLEAPARLNSKSLLDVLYLLGISKDEQEELVKLV